MPVAQILADLGIEALPIGTPKGRDMQTHAVNTWSVSLNPSEDHLDLRAENDSRDRGQSARAASANLVGGFRPSRGASAMDT